VVSSGTDMDNCLTPSPGKEFLKFALDLTKHMLIYHIQ